MSTNSKNFNPNNPNVEPVSEVILKLSVYVIPPFNVLEPSELKEPIVIYLLLLVVKLSIDESDTSESK